MKIPFQEIKRFIGECGAPKEDLFAASTKFALVAVAEKHGIRLEPLLDAVGTYEPSKPLTTAATKEDAPAKVDAKAAQTVKTAKAREAAAGG